MKHVMRCPDLRCKRELSHFDVERFANREGFRRYKEYKSANYRERLLKDIDENMIKLLRIADIAKERLKNRKVVLKPGDIIDSPYKELRQLYRGVIVEINEGKQTAVVAFDDGDLWDAAPLASVVKISSTKTSSGGGPIDPNELSSGMRVMAGWKEGVLVYPGTIESLSIANRTADIQYDDGDRWKEVPYDRIFELAGGVSLSPPIKCCPQCNVLIHKSAGCDTLMCTCGASFQWHSADVLPKEILENLIAKEMEKLDAVEKEEEERKGRKSDQLRQVLGELTNQVHISGIIGSQKTRENGADVETPYSRNATFGGKVWNLLSAGIH